MDRYIFYDKIIQKPYRIFNELTIIMSRENKNCITYNILKLEKYLK